MKKNLISLAVLVAVFMAAIPAKAQIKFGVKAGLNVNSVSLKGDIKKNFDASNRTGFFAGLTADVTLPLVGLGADISLLYDNKVFREIAESTGASSATISRVNKCIMYGTGGYKTAIERMKENEE